MYMLTGYTHKVHEISNDLMSQFQMSLLNFKYFKKKQNALLNEAAAFFHVLHYTFSCFSLIPVK